VTWVSLVILVSMALACVPFALLRNIPDFRTYVLVTIGGALIAIALGVAGTAISDLRKARDAAALAAASAEARP
jgi:hypothetical protein